MSRITPDPEADETDIEKAVRIASIALGVGLNLYMVWTVILPEELKITIRSRLAPMIAAWKSQRHSRSERRQTAFEMWLITQAIEEYNTNHDIDEFRTKLGLGSALPDPRPRTAGLGQTEDL